MAAAEIVVTLKSGLFDAQGATVLKALHQLGHQQVRGVSIGRHITVDVDEALTGPALQEQLDLMCRQLLANPVIEDYEVTLTPTLSTAPVRGGTPVVTTRAAASWTAAATTVAGAAAVEPVTTPGGVPVTDPFILDYTSYEALSAAARLALQQAAWVKHGEWVRQEFKARGAVWILTVGHAVVDSGTTLDSMPDLTRQEHLGVAHDLVPFVFLADVPAPR